MPFWMSDKRIILIGSVLNRIEMKSKNPVLSYDIIQVLLLVIFTFERPNLKMNEEEEALT